MDSTERPYDAGLPTAAVLCAVAWYLAAPLLLAGALGTAPKPAPTASWVLLPVLQAAIAGITVAIFMVTPAGRMEPAARHFGLRPLRAGSLFAVPAAGVGSIAAAYLIAAAEHAAGVAERQTAGIRMLLASHGASLALAVLAVCVVGPAVEELIFRGLIYGHLRRRLPAAGATVITSLAFAVVHPDLAYSLLPLTAIGALLCWCRERTGSTWASMVAHGIYNAGVLALLAARL